MGVVFDGSTDYLSWAIPFDVNYPFTVSCWVKPDSITTTYNLWEIGRSGENNNRWAGGIQNTGAFSFSARTSGGSAPSAVTANTMGTSGAWYHHCAVGRSATSRDCYLNGDIANKGTNTNSENPNGTMDEIQIGRVDTVFGYAGIVGHWCLIDDHAATDAEVAGLAAGFDPRKLFPGKSIRYFPLNGNVSAEFDIFDPSNAFTHNGTPTKGEDPPIPNFMLIAG